MKCPLCGKGRARRGCPAVGQQICTVCCGTKRLVEIRCPADCAYLAASREHPSSAVVRRYQQELDALDHCLRDLNERQLQLFFLVNTFFKRYEPPALNPLIDEDIAGAAAALASTFETASRGVIYEYRAASATADRLAAALKAVLTEAGHGGGSVFERDAAVVLHRVEEAVHALAVVEPSNRRAYVEMAERVFRDPEQTPRNQEPGGSSLIQL